ncbi:ClpP/crotonase-like domain-containing protein [Helicostylum pulchrum]|nr:ClpP/crotonase-like domain-containing protein [Helicostylum pulchrum]
MYPRVARQLIFVQKRLLTAVARMTSPIEELPVLTSSNKNTRTLLLNRPHKLNALNLPMIEYISLYLKASLYIAKLNFPNLIIIQEWENSGDINMIFLEGQGRALCSGADIKAVVEMLEDPSRRNELKYFVEKFYNVLGFMGEMKTPMISFMDGITMGSGYSFSSLSRFSIATENTKVAMPENRFGHFVDAASSFYLPRVNGNLGKYMALTAAVIKAEDVLLSGLATHFVPSDKLDFVHESLVNLYQPSCNTINETIKKFSIKVDDIPASDILQYENMNTIKRCFQFDTVPEIFEALEKEGSKFAQETMDQMHLGSPISLALTLEHHRRGSMLPLAQCLQLEHHSWGISPYQPDFYEGVTSTLIKKRKPQWSHTSYLDVDFKKEIIERYF